MSQRTSRHRLRTGALLLLASALVTGAATADRKTFPNSFCRTAGSLASWFRTDTYLEGTAHNGGSFYVNCPVVRDLQDTNGTVVAEIAVANPYTAPGRPDMWCQLTSGGAYGSVTDAAWDNAVPVTAVSPRTREILNLDVNYSYQWGYYHIQCFLPDGDPHVISYRIHE